jgi:hypothetical protein
MKSNFMDDWIVQECEVTEVTNANDPDVHLGEDIKSILRETDVMSLIGEIRKQQGFRAYLLKWKGNLRVPSGVHAGNCTIGMTQHGIVDGWSDEDMTGKTIEEVWNTVPVKMMGDYSRVKDGPGEQIMVIRLWGRP